MKLGAALFYVFLSLLGLALARVFHVNFWHVSPLVPHFPSLAVIPSGLALGVIVVILSHILDRFPRFARLNALIARHLPYLGLGDIIFLSVLSSFSEELLFRGVLLQVIGIHASSFIFGLLHYGGKRDFVLWGLMGWAMGYLLAGIFFLTGSLLAPILAHFTINYFNLIHIVHTYKARTGETEPEE